MVDQVILRNMICAYFHKKDLPILSTLRLIPVEQILDVAENHNSYPILKLNEVLVRIIFKEIEPKPLFSFREEIKKIKSLVKLVSFKRMIFKKMMVGRIHAMRKIKKLRNILERVKKEEAVKVSKKTQSVDPQSTNLNDQEKPSQPPTIPSTGPSKKAILNLPTNSPFGPNLLNQSKKILMNKMHDVKNFMEENSNILVIFLDQVFIIVLREIQDMNSHLDIYRNLIKSVSEETLELMIKAFLQMQKGKQPAVLKLIGNHLKDPANKNPNQVKDFMQFIKSSQHFGESQDSSSDYSFGMDMMSESSSSFSNLNLKLLGKGFNPPNN